MTLGVGATFATESNPDLPPTGLKDLPKLVNPAGLVELAHNEIRWEERKFRRQVADLKAGKPEALIELSFTGARLAGADAGVLTGAKFVYHLATLDDAARNERLDTALPRKVSEAPDRAFRKVLHAVVRGAISGDWNVGDALIRDASGQALDLIPATVNSANDAANEITTKLEASRS